MDISKVGQPRIAKMRMGKTMKEMNLRSKSLMMNKETATHTFRVSRQYILDIYVH